MRRSVGVLYALALAALLALSGCMSVKQVKIPEEREGWIAHGAITADLFEMSNSHLGGILSIAKKELTAEVNQMGIRNEEDAIAYLNELLKTGTRAPSVYYVGSDALLDAAQGMLPTFEIEPEELDWFTARYEDACSRLGSRYGYTREKLDAIRTVSAYDYDQLITMARMLFALEFLSEDDCWFYVETGYNRALEDYTSWEEYAAGYALGMMLISDDNTYATVLDPVLLSESSPYLGRAFGG